MKTHAFIRRPLLLLTLLFCLVPAMAFADTQLQPPAAGQVVPAPTNPDRTGPGSSGGIPPNHSPSGAMADIHDIKPVIPPDEFPTTALWIAAAALVLILLLLLGRYLWRRRKKGGEIPTLTPELPPEENARLALNALAAERLVDGRRFYFRLSEILRRYLFERYAIGAPEMTPEELQPLVARLDLPDGQRAVLNAFWSHSEPVKFAGRVALENDMTADLEQMRSFVEVTTAAMRVPEEAAPAAAPDNGPPPVSQRGG